MNNPLANSEDGGSEWVQKMFAMYIIFGEEDEFTFTNDGSVSTVSKRDMLGRSIIRAKLKSQIKIQQQEQARNALMVMQTLIGVQGINKEELVHTLVPIITQGVINRQQAESFVDQGALTPELVAQLQQLVQQNSPEPPVIDQAMTDQLAPQDVDQMMAASQSAIGPTGQANVPMDPTMSGYDMDRQNAPVVDTGMDNYTAGLESSNANPMGGLI